MRMLLFHRRRMMRGDYRQDHESRYAQGVVMLNGRAPLLTTASEPSMKK